MKRLQIIYMKSNDEAKQSKLADTLLIHGVTCFKVGNHVLVIDDKPRGTRVGTPTSEKDSIKILHNEHVNKAMKNAQAILLQFDDKAFKALKKYFSKQYKLNKVTKSSMSFKSKTQRANFTLHKNGCVSTSKDLLDMDLIISIVRICYGGKPLDITSVIK